MKSAKSIRRTIASTVLAVFCVLSFTTAIVRADPSCPASNDAGTTINKTDGKVGTQTFCCGSSDSGGVVYTSIDFGCRHQGTAIVDLTFAIIRFLSNGVAFVLVASLVVAGVMYTTSRGDPQATKAAIARIRSNVIALMVFLFAYALLNYIIPGAVF